MYFPLFSQSGLKCHIGSRLVEETNKICTNDDILSRAGRNKISVE